MKVVYKSNAGHAKRYAEMLAQKLNVECFDLKNYKIDNDQIIYIGWVFGSMIMGLNKVKDCNLLCIGAVGMNNESKENTDLIIKTNNTDKKVFYLQGGLDYTKLKGIKKLMIKIVANSAIKQNKPEDQEMIEVFKHGKDFVKEENLNQMIEYINNIK